jgi:CRISPR-associated protein Cas2
MESVYLVCYDIADPKRLRRVHRATQDRGPRLQLSVYECRLTRLQLALFQAELIDLIDGGEDQVLFVRLGPTTAPTHERIEALGRPYVRLDHRASVV